MEKMPFDKQEECIKYHHNRFLAAGPVDPFYQSKYDTLILHLFNTDLSFAGNKAKLYTAYSLYGNYYFLVEHDYAQALAYFETALKYEFSAPFMQCRKMLRMVMKSYVLYKLGRKKECFSTLKRVQEFLTSNKKNKDFQGKLYFKLLSFEYCKMQARLLAEEKQYKSALNVLPGSL